MACIKIGLLSKLTNCFGISLLNLLPFPPATIIEYFFIFQNNNSASVPFLQKVDFTVGKQPIGVVSGDFNFDGTFMAIGCGDNICRIYNIKNDFRLD
jgi:hypothetical protein